MRSQGHPKLLKRHKFFRETGFMSVTPMNERLLVKPAPTGFTFVEADMIQ
jgi:hypothetical protein